MSSQYLSDQSRVRSLYRHNATLPRHSKRHHPFKARKKPYKRPAYYGKPRWTLRKPISFKDVYIPQTPPRAPFRPGLDRISTGIPISGELKFFDTFINNAQIGNGEDWSLAASQTDSINLIPQGTSLNERVGNQCTITLIQINMRHKHPNAAGHDDNHLLRMYVFQDKQCNGVAATTSDLMQVNSIYAFYNHNNRFRFKPLLDKTYTGRPGTSLYNGISLEQGETHTHLTATIPCKIPIRFDNTTGAITELASNNIGIHWGSTRPTGTSITIKGYIRVWFTDF